MSIANDKIELEENYSARKENITLKIFNPDKKIKETYKSRKV